MKIYLFFIKLLIFTIKPSTKLLEKIKYYFYTPQNLIMKIKLNQIPVQLDTQIPLEFKEINPSDFQDYEVEEKIIIEPDENGFIYKSLNEVFDFEVKNTLVINAAVGQGKSFAVNIFAKEYYIRQGGHKVFIVVPFKSLIEQYYKKLIELEIPEYEILDYQKLDTYSNKNSPTFHLITINSLLGNFGEKSVSQSEIKKQYLNNLILHCKNNHFKAVFFIDEVHDSIKNFKELFVFNLLKWKDITHKVIVSSATYNETSKIVIKYLSEITSHKIRIIESNRVIIEDKVSNLNLVFLQQVQKFNIENRLFLNLLERECAEGRKIDILTYTKTLAEKILKKESSAYKILTKYNQIPNLCTSNSTTSFDPKLCNIGTNFKTGISIDDDNSTFIIIVPPIDCTESNIFSDGINSIIQAIARPRKKSEIYIILPFPDGLIKPIKLENNHLLEIAKIRPSFYEDFKYNYQKINNQYNLFKSFYKEHKSNFKEEIKSLKLANRVLKPRIKFPSYDIYALEYAEKYFYTKHEIFGKNIPAYIIWAALNNQFFNCRLNTFINTEFTNLQEGKIQVGLEEFYKNKFAYSNPFFELNSDLFCFNIIKRELFSSNIAYTNNEGITTKITEGTVSKHHRHILSFIQRKKSAINWEFRKKFYPNDLIDREGNFNDPIDYEYQIDDYLRACISISTNDDYVIENLSDRELISLYRAFSGFKTIFIDKYLFNDNNHNQFFLSDNKIIDYDIIENDDYSEFCRVINDLKLKDVNLKMFSFFQGFDSTDTIKTKKTIYSFIRKLFFETKVGRIFSTQFPDENKANIYKKEIELGDGFSSLNLIYEPTDPWIYQSGHGYAEDIFNDETLSENITNKHLDEDNTIQ